MLFESAVICEYLDEITPDSLHPDDPLQKAKYRSWIEFGSSILNGIAGFYNAFDKDKFKQKRGELAQKFTWVEQNLGSGDYFAGDAFCLVDAVYGTIFRYFDVFDKIADFSVFADTPKVRDWRRSLHGRSSIQAAVTEDYSDRLLTFLKQRNAYLSTLIL